jgi:hypothetical protein
MSLLKTSVALYKAESGLFSDVVLILLISKYRKGLRYTRKCNLIYAREKSRAFHAPICTELTSDQQNSITALSADFSLVPNVTQIGKSMWKVWTAITLPRYVKYVFTSSMPNCSQT